MSLCVPNAEITRFIVDCMVKVGTMKNQALLLADALCMADYRGHYSHGLNRLDMYMRDIQSGTTNSADQQPNILKQTPATALVDGCNLLGINTLLLHSSGISSLTNISLNNLVKNSMASSPRHFHTLTGPVVGEFCMKLAIQKAKNVGIGWISAKNSNHYGICAFYSRMALEHSLIGISLTNTSPLTIPTRGKQKTLGTNPIAISAPAKNGDSFDLDMATSAVAWGKVEIAHRRDEQIPIGWAANKHGHNTTDPAEVLDGGGLLPLGSLEETSSYKGYGLSMAIEVLTSILSGGQVGPNVRNWTTSDIKADLGQTFVAIDPSAFEDNFTDRMSNLMDHCRALPPKDGSEEVLVAGDPERKQMEMCDKIGGIPYHENQIKYANDIAERFGVAALKVNQ